MEDKIEKKFNENIEIIRKDMDNQTKTNEKQTKEFQLTLRILEEKKAEKAKQKENNRNLTEEKHVIALQTLESNIKQNNEVFTSFQNLVLSFHQNETKKLEDISSTIANMKTSDTRKRSESLDEGEIDQTLQEKMLDHLELLENKLKSSSKKPRKIQKTPLKILAPSKEWAIGELESDKDSQEDAIYSSELFSNTLRFSYFKLFILADF